MKPLARTVLLPLVLLCAASLAQAGSGAPAEQPGCVHLGQDQQITRQGNARQFLLRDGRAQYQVTLQRDCSALPAARVGLIERNGAQHLLCQRGSALHTDRGTCEVARVQRIEPVLEQVADSRE
ncbi:hypothetical protein EIM48_11530 [Pseudoxanthomonas sp. SGNA-20]|uniref:hypothetical protein n=1 Tax=unclassified Pseudoxanthomonas TaxID=2645906 RepID=UPI00035ECECC|nr:MULTISPECIES: hypothetical protein [unclassified Pseudoxanthomonas]RRN55371.1 hypothetical protein EIM48_11530 [Pseudoxanthomonas sp. SGNA-20]